MSNAMCVLRFCCPPCYCWSGLLSLYLTSSSSSLRAACFDCLICKSSLCKKSLADSSSGCGRGGLSSVGGEGGGDGPSTLCVITRGVSAGPSPSGDSRDRPLKMERRSDTTGMLRLFFRKMQSLLNSLLARLICSIWRTGRKTVSTHSETNS